ncbi:Nn.00g069630.m01.CDS01 [Neocucurbitaria sp. VM-36]
MVHWTAEKDQIILKGIFKFHDIKSSAPLLKYLADAIGEDCTPKAVSHRLTSIRNGGNGSARGGRSNGSVSNTPARASTTSKTPRSRVVKSTPKKHKVSSDNSDGDSKGTVDDEDDLVSPSAAAGKRGKRHSYVEPESDGEDDGARVSKRVKLEPIDDEEDLSFEILADAYTEDIEV